MPGEGTRKRAMKKPTGTPIGDQIVGSVRSGIIALDADGAIITANPSAARILGVLEPALAPGKRLEKISGIAPLIELVREVFESRAASTRREIVLQHDGERREIGLSIGLLEGDAPFNGILLLFADITERRNLERAAELNRQLATLGELTAGVVHELRNPLMVISGMAELLLRELDETTRSYSSASLIFQEAQNLERAIAQFLSFARPFDIAPSPCSPAEICERVIQLCDQRALRKCVELELILNEELPTAELDATRAAQAIANIVGNAVDAVADGSGYVMLTARRDRENILFEIVDNGPGIHLEDGEDLFKPFFTKKESGTGLGLAIAHRIITAHHGSVRHYNRVEGGACFEIVMPIERARDW